MFTLSPQENFPVDSRRIYELIKLLFKKNRLFFFNNWSALGSRSHLALNARTGGVRVRGRHLGRTRQSRRLCAPVEAVSTPPSARLCVGRLWSPAKSGLRCSCDDRDGVPERTCRAHSTPPRLPEHSGSCPTPRPAGAGGRGPA